MNISDLKILFQEKLSSLYTAAEIEQLLYIFVEEILGLNRFQFRNWNGGLSNEQYNLFINSVLQLKEGKPYQYIIGKAEFFGETFFVDENTLIPRPETEELLELAIDEIQKKGLQNPKILDIGTGSGVIPIILKKYFPEAEICSMDISSKALEVAKRNAEFHKVEINFVENDYLKNCLSEKYDVIISNPPYIAIEENAEIEHSVKGFEPNLALFSPNEDALIFYRKISQDAENHLKKNGLIFLEINQKYGKETADLFQKFVSVRLLKDLSENDRFVIVNN